jgi:hypothetical protein
MHRHYKPGLIQIYTDMSFLLRPNKALYLLGFLTVLVTAVSAEETKPTPLLTALAATTVNGAVTSSATTKSLDGNYVTPLGSEVLLLGNVNGDQVNASLSLGANGGWLAWEDNGIDRVGAGIGARQILDSSFTVAPTSVTVNRVATGDQITPHVVCLTNKSTLFVWQSASAGTPDIYARIMKTNGVFATIDLRMNYYIKDAQAHPAVAALADGSAMVVWQSAWQDGSPNGIFARKIGPTGLMSPVREFEVNQFNNGTSPYRSQRTNRRNPAVALLPSGQFVVVWVSEQQRAVNSIDLYGRIFNANLTPATDEFHINSSTNACADPQVIGFSDGGFTVVWSERDFHNRFNGWDVAGRAFMADGTPKGDEFIVNTFRFGDQFQPKIASSPNGCLVVWTSMGQDGSREGVFGQFLLGGNQLAGPEMMVNTTRVSQQLQPAVAWNGVDRFLVVWSGFVANYGFDLFGQSYTLNSQ